MKNFISIKLRHADNGVIMTIIEPEEETREVLYQNPMKSSSSKEDLEIEAFADFLRTINELCGPTTSRYSKKRIHINLIPGDKSEEFE